MKRMTRMTYKTLMSKIQNGQAEVVSWSGDYAHVLFFKSNGTTKRQVVEVTNVPSGFLR